VRFGIDHAQLCSDQILLRPQHAPDREHCLDYKAQITANQMSSRISVCYFRRLVGLIKIRKYRQILLQIPNTTFHRNLSKGSRAASCGSTGITKLIFERA